MELTSEFHIQGYFDLYDYRKHNGDGMILILHEFK